VEITRADFVGIPSTDFDRARAFYVDTLGLRRDAHSQTEFWAGDQCFTLWKPEWVGMEFAPATTSQITLHVADVPEARAELEAKGVEFEGEIFDTGVCHFAFFFDPDGNRLALHNRYRPYE
jgi:catechol 2,3-dioxygenase-like lactoylglutathione lyase family enzyme